MAGAGLDRASPVLQYSIGMRLVGCAAFACLLLWAAPGVGSAFAAEKGFIQTALNSDGSGELLAGVHEGHEGPVKWQVCAADGLDCQPFGEGNPIDTGSAPSDSVFIATEPLTQYEATSPVWYGNLSPATAPSVSGAIRANALVTPVSGTWNGGWEKDFQNLQLAACKGPEGTECTALSDPPWYAGCPNEAAVIDPMFTGQYLRVADHVYGPGTVFADYALLSPYGAGVWAAGPTVSVAVVGQIMPATGPPESSCGPPPRPKTKSEAPESPQPVTKPPASPPPPASGPKPGYPSLTLSTAPRWTKLAISRRFGYTPTRYSARRCRRTGAGRFRCAVSWRHAGSRFAGTVEVGNVDIYTGASKLGFRIERSSRLHRHRRQLLVHAYSDA